MPNQAEACEADTRRLETVLARLDEATHEQETLLAQARQQIATEETTLSHESLAGGGSGNRPGPNADAHLPN